MIDVLWSYAITVAGDAIYTSQSCDSHILYNNVTANNIIIIHEQCGDLCVTDIDGSWDDPQHHDCDIYTYQSICSCKCQGSQTVCSIHALWWIVQAWWYTQSCCICIHCGASLMAVVRGLYCYDIVANDPMIMFPDCIIVHSATDCTIMMDGHHVPDNV